MCFSVFLFWVGFTLSFGVLRGEIGILGWSSLVVSIWFLSGLVIFVLGVIGLYVGKIFNEVRGRPAFIVSEVLAVDRTTNAVAELPSTSYETSQPLQQRTIHSGPC